MWDPTVRAGAIYLWNAKRVKIQPAVYKCVHVRADVCLNVHMNVHGKNVLADVCLNVHGKNVPVDVCLNVHTMYGPEFSHSYRELIICLCACA